MASRSVGATLGLLAFITTIVAGLWVHNPVTTTLSRALIAMFVFCVIGAVMGTAAQLVVREHAADREKAASSTESADVNEPVQAEELNTSIAGEAKPMGT